MITLDFEKLYQSLHQQAVAQAQVEAEQEIDTLITPGKHFKIGKSGDDEADTEARYSAYDNWEVIYRSTDEKLIDDLEVALIEQYMESHPDTCDDKQADVGPDGGCTYIYLAYN